MDLKHSFTASTTDTLDHASIVPVMDLIMNESIEDISSAPLAVIESTLEPKTLTGPVLPPRGPISQDTPSSEYTATGGIDEMGGSTVPRNVAAPLDTTDFKKEESLPVLETGGVWNE